MASATFAGAGWIPVETNPDVIQAVKASSAVDNLGHHVKMGSQTKWTPRSGGLHLSKWAKGAGAPADATGNDSVLLNADKIGGKVAIDDEDKQDSLASIVDAKAVDAGTSYARLFDNVSLGITAAKATSGWGFDSLYWLLTQSETTTGYTANSNLTLAGTGGITYDVLSDALSLYENGKFFDPTKTVVIADNSFMGVLRKIKSNTGEPIFNESSSGDAGGGQGGTLRLFGHTLQLTMGAKTSAAGSDSPTGNPFIVFGNRDFLQVGDRFPLAVNYQDAESGIGVDSDQDVLYFKARKAFAVGAPGAFSMLVKNV
jgi:HK97 family phage major capsid protein